MRKGFIERWFCNFRTSFIGGIVKVSVIFFIENSITICVQRHIGYIRNCIVWDD
jgi:hypothetical protein